MMTGMYSVIISHGKLPMNIIDDKYGKNIKRERDCRHEQCMSDQDRKTEYCFHKLFW